MIPSTTANRSVKWEKHVHSLFGLRVSDFSQDNLGVILDDSPFILDGSTPKAEAGDSWQQVISEPAYSPLVPLSIGPPVGEQTITDQILTPKSGGGRGWLLKTLPGVRDIEVDATGVTENVGYGGTEGFADNSYKSHFLEKDNTNGSENEGKNYGISFALDTSGWFTTPDTTGPLLLDAQDTATGWINKSSWKWNADDSPPNFNESLACKNLSFNGSGCLLEDAAPLVITPESLALCLLLLFFAVSTIFGNGLVIVAVTRERYLHTVTNYFIMSLAVADCLVGAFVMPFSALYDSFDYWPFGPDFCDVWRSFDVLASTASILNLCVISLDRYWAITDPFSYPSRMSPRRACLLIALVWVCSALISFPAIAWWRVVSNPHPAGVCPFTEDLSYLVFSSIISFYGPLFVMVFTYFRIYRAATEQTRSLKLGQKLVSSIGNGDMELTLRIHRGGGGTGGSTSSNGNDVHRANYPAGKTCSITQENGGISDPHGIGPPLEEGESYPLGTMHEGISPDSSTKVVARNLKNFSISRKLCKFAKEKKAAKTLGIVMGVFIVCWLPFFVTNLLSGLCGERCIREPALVDGVVTWLGWINSAMNPVIYACWAKDFRR
ncbi:dopamine receptor 2-like [Homarus americanus]|uniref:Dopamine receptor 2-like n=3 Tax=Homarus americanus TaxID=6706 RepID=A0A8J5K219_HOMAM|nr:dopamine receptor 2-like [Homarus americanus]KAG7165295.1 Dopamine receptor 2-like [Homarus americanus]